MKTFIEIKESVQTLNEYVKLNENDFEFLNEAEKAQLQEVLKEFGDKKISELDEGFFSNLLGGVTGFFIGPAIGKVIANALGIEKGIFYDMLTSRLVSTALGAAVGKYASASK